MKLAIALPCALAALAFAATGPARADLRRESVQYVGHLRMDLSSSVANWVSGAPSTELAGDVYNNTNPRAHTNFGLAANDLNSIWGDRLATTGTGTLLENDFTVVNSGQSAGVLLSAAFRVALYDAATNAFLGGYTTNPVSFGSGLNPGFYDIITITGLSSLNIPVNTTDVLMVQQVASFTGPANRLGIVSFDPPTIGSSGNTMYIDSADFGPAGYYIIDSPDLIANPGYRLNLGQPVPVDRGSWGRVKALYH